MSQCWPHSKLSLKIATGHVIYFDRPEYKTVREEGCQEALLNKIAKPQCKPIVLTNRERQGPPFSHHIV